MKKGEDNMRLHWEFVNESLNGEEQSIVVGNYGKRMRLKDGHNMVECDNLNCYRAAFTVSGEEIESHAELIGFDLGYQYHINRIDYYLNHKKIGTSHCCEETVRFLIPKADLAAGENRLFVVILWGAGLGIDGETCMNPGFTTEIDALPACLELYHLKAMPGVISFTEQKDGVLFALENGETAKITFYENGIWRYQYPEGAKQCVDEYCLDQLDQNLRTVAPKKLAHEEGSMTYSCGENILKIDMFPFRVRVYDREGKPLLIQKGDMLVSEDTGVVSVELAEDEHIFGINENGNPHLDKRGSREDVWVCHDFDRCDVFVPYYLSTAGYGFYLNSSYHSIFDMGASIQDTAFMYTNTNVIDFFFIPGKTPADIVSNFTAITGRGILPPKWSFGFWQAGVGKTVDTQEKCINVVKRYEQEEIPLDVLCLDRWHDMLGDMEWGVDRFPDPDAFMAFLKEHHVHMIAWMCPFGPTKTKELYREGLKKDMFMLGEDGKMLPTNSWCGYASGLMDFEKDTMLAWLIGKIKPLLAIGIDGFKLDGGDAHEVPERIVSHKGKSGKEIHNLYPLMFAKGIQTILKELMPNRRVITWERTGFAGSGKYPITWGGDQLANFHGTRCLVKGGQGAGLCGIPFWSQDVGGFCMTPETDEEFFVRSYQWGVIAPFARAHGAKTQPWSYTERSLQIVGDFVRLRYRLMPYIYSLAYESSKTGKPMMYPLFFFDPKDELTYSKDYQYGFGPALMIAPVVEKSNNEECIAEKEIYLPKGKWVELNSYEVYEGKQTLHRNVPLEELPMFVKMGAVIPTVTVPKQIAHMDFTDLTVYFFPDEETAEFDFYNDEGNDLSYQKGNYNSIRFCCRTNEITISTIASAYDPNYKAHIVCRVFGKKPESVKVNKEAVEFVYDEDKKQTVFQVDYKIGECFKAVME